MLNLRGSGSRRYGLTLGRFQCSDGCKHALRDWPRRLQMSFRGTPRFRGTCCRVADWSHLGQTPGGGLREHCVRPASNPVTDIDFGCDGRRQYRCRSSALDCHGRGSSGCRPSSTSLPAGVLSLRWHSGLSPPSSAAGWRQGRPSPVQPTLQQMLRRRGQTLSEIIHVSE